LRSNSFPEHSVREGCVVNRVGFDGNLRQFVLELALSNLSADLSDVPVLRSMPLVLSLGLLQTIQVLVVVLGSFSFCSAKIKVTYDYEHSTKLLGNR
jgi:hypothetical protein